jgi:hypothetical protein
VQLELSTDVPSERWQNTATVCVAEFASATQVPERVWFKPVPQPVVGVQEEYCQLPVPPVQVLGVPEIHEKVQVLKSAIVCVVAGAVPALATHRLLSTVVPSDCVQESVRVWMAVEEQVLEDALQALGTQL